jgi:hypothetical protein
MEVLVPDGCGPGDEIYIDHMGSSLSVRVPEGVYAGQAMLVDLGGDTTVDECQLVDVVVPDGCGPGDLFIAEFAECGEFEVIVPDGCFAGTMIQVELPPPPPPPPPDEAPAARRRAQTFDSDEPPPPPPPLPPPPRSLTPESIAADTSSSDGGEDAPKFPVGQPAEVRRTDGTWTLVTVEEYDANACNYTVALADGRKKYWVEPDDLRIPRFMLMSHGLI